MFVIDKTSPEALYRQLKSQARQAIDSGLWAPGQKLPSERELIDLLGISRITVRQAYRELVAEGYLTSAAGKGVFVAARAEAHELDALVSFTAAMRDSGVATSSRVITCEVQQSAPAIAAAMQLDAGAEVVHLHRVRIANHVPVSVQQVWLPHALVPGLADVDFSTASLFELLRGTYGLRTARAETIISARVLDKEEASSLDLVDQAIGLTVDQYTYDPSDRVIELSRSIHHPTRLPVRISQAVSARPGSTSLLAHPHPTQPRS